MPVIPTILYVDDDVDNCEMMKYWIREECGCDIAIAMDGKEALEMIQSQYFDLFLLDYCLPDTTGIKLCEEIRAIYPEAPIAIYSALDRAVDKEKALAAGATAYFVKPEQLGEINIFADQYIATSRKRKTSISDQKASETGSVKHRSRFRSAGIL